MSATRDEASRPRSLFVPIAFACVAVSLAAGALIPVALALAIALVAAATLTVIALAQPVLAVALLLAVGGMPMEGLTGGQKILFQGFGGASASGVVLVAMIAVLSLVFISNRALSHVSFLDIALALVLAVGAASTLWAPVPVEGLRVLAKTAYPMLILLAARSLLVRERERDIALRFIVAGGLAVTLLGLYGLLTSGWQVYLSGGVYRYTSGLSHPTPFGFYMVALFALCYSRWRELRSTGSAALSVLFGLQAILSMSRMAMLGVVLVIVLTELVLGPPRTRWLRAAAIGTALAAAFVVTVLVVPRLQEGVFYSPQSLHSTPSDLLQSINDQGRSAIREAMLSDLSSRGSWLFGNGFGSSTVALQRGALGDLGGVGVAHDEYVRLLYETGVVGLMVVLIAMATLVVTSWRVASELPERYRWLGATAVSLTVCYAVFAATDNVLDYYAIFSQFAFFAVGAALAASAAEKVQEESVSRSSIGVDREVKRQARRWA